MKEPVFTVKQHRLIKQIAAVNSAINFIEDLVEVAEVADIIQHLRDVSAGLQKEVTNDV